jgi:hypothetical protein
MCYNKRMKMGNRTVSPESATEWLLKLIVWEFFCTLTWNSRARSCGRKRQTHVTRWLRYWARRVRPGVADPLGQLAFVIRWERGEIGGLPHCHILISRIPERSINRSTCFAMKNTWKHGIAQVRLYDPYTPGDVSRYLSKGRFSSAADCEGANTYELRKFDRADWLYISPGAWAEMREARTVARRMSPLPS